MSKSTPLTLLTEIQKQPDLLRVLYLTQLEILQDTPNIPLNLQKIIAIAEGSSKNVLDIASPFWEEWLGLPVWVHLPEALEQKMSISTQYGKMDTLSPDQTPSGTSFRIADLIERSLLFLVSQSGETGSILRLLDKLLPHLHPHSYQVVSLTNRDPSSLSKRFQHLIYLGIGEEKSIAATKSMTASLYLCLLWALQIANHTQRLSQTTFNRFQKELETVPQQLETLLTPQFLKQLKTFTQKLVEVNHFILLSKGPLSLILPEIGLKLTETSSNIVYTDNTESFKHGPKVILSGVNGVHPNTVYLIPTDIESAEILFKDIRSHFWPPSDGDTHHPPTYGSDRVFFVMFENSPSIPTELLKDLNISSEQNILKLPAVSTLIGSLFMGIVAFQLISYYLAETKGENPDNPMLEKAVVLE